VIWRIDQSGPCGGEDKMLLVEYGVSGLLRKALTVPVLARIFL
jgi:hypothetical protein